MLKYFLYLYKAIKAIINNSNSKTFKDKTIILEEYELIYLNNIFVAIVMVGADHLTMRPPFSRIS
jgi:hypothetical protein